MRKDLLSMSTSIKSNRSIPQKRLLKAGLKDVVYGAAIGDALGVPYEFMLRDSFKCIQMESGGIHNQPAGTFSDDTSMMLATCKSIKDNNGIKVEDIRKNFQDWLYSGEYAIDKKVFDVGNTIADAIGNGQGKNDQMSNGNGSLMRIAPLAFVKNIKDSEIEAVSAITHAHFISTKACAVFIHVLIDLMNGVNITNAIAVNVPSDKEFEFLNNITNEKRNNVASGGYVLDTLGADLWCFANTNSYRQCVCARSS